METYLLKFLDFFTWTFRLIKVDYSQLRAIVATKLLIDSRRQHISFSRKSNTESGNAFLMTLFFYAIFGGFVALAMYSIPSFMLSMIFFFAYIMVMVAMTLITDFSSILLDTSDNTIILPRPVDGRTLFVSRITHILLYLGQLTFALSVFPIILVLLKYGGMLTVFFLLALVLSIITALVLTNAVYLLILQFASEEKLRNVINSFQIFMAVAIMGGYQILPRIMERLDMETYVFEIKWWSYLLPPVWMAGMLELTHFGFVDAKHIGLAICAISLPPASAYLVSRYLTPVFSKKLGALNGGIQPIEKHKKEKDGLVSRISSWITSTAAEQGAFNLIYKILARDRKIKLKIYPAFGYIIIFGLIFLLRGKEDFATTWANLPNSDYHLLLLYLTVMVLQVALYEIPYSDDFKASWIYFSTPIIKPGEILAGTLKAIFVKLFLPGYIAISTLVLFVWGIAAWDDIIFGLFNNFLMLLTLALINKRHVPLSMAPNVRTQTGNLLRGILTFLLIAILGMVHYLLARQPLLLIGMIPVQMIVIYFLHRRYTRTQWHQISL